MTYVFLSLWAVLATVVGIVLASRGRARRFAMPRRSQAPPGHLWGGLPAPLWGLRGGSPRKRQ